MMAVKFEGWLAALLGQSETEVESLLRSTMALHFLIAWSLFESKCFGGCQSFAKLDEFADRLVNKEAFVAANVSGASEHFHKRYQEASLYKHLMQKQKSPRMDALVKAPFASLPEQDIVFLMAATACRFRNNMFHGNKGVGSWLQYETEIELCTISMRRFVSHAESIAPTMNVPRGA